MKSKLNISDRDYGSKKKFFFSVIIEVLKSFLDESSL